MPSAAAALPAYPPTAHTHGYSDLTTKQPTQSVAMSARGPPPPKQKNEQSAERLRGGCVPCPDGSICWIIPIPCCCC
ncbi:unnamed protein product [Peniophora sp. CBMAI 1063]|nr:unnamed protein product [Peniophora sp. CBMAI 1063]